MNALLVVLFYDDALACVTDWQNVGGPESWESVAARLLIRLMSARSCAIWVLNVAVISWYPAGLVEFREVMAALSDWTCC